MSDFYRAFEHSIHTAGDIVKLLCRLGSSIILVFLIPSADTQFHGKPLQQAFLKSNISKSVCFMDNVAREH